VNDGTYQHPMIDYQIFSVARYQDWLGDLVKE
jgi:hypothetical protein